MCCFYLAVHAYPLVCAPNWCDVMCTYAQAIIIRLWLIMYARVKPCASIRKERRKKRLDVFIFIRNKYEKHSIKRNTKPSASYNCKQILCERVCMRRLCLFIIVQWAASGFSVFLCSRFDRVSDCLANWCVYILIIRWYLTNMTHNANAHIIGMICKQSENESFCKEYTQKIRIRIRNFRWIELNRNEMKCTHVR